MVNEKDRHLVKSVCRRCRYLDDVRILDTTHEVRFLCTLLRGWRDSEIAGYIMQDNIKECPFFESVPVGQYFEPSGYISRR